ncbi:MAG: chlorite dismutase family protein [Caldilineaceae bacterium]
MSEQQPQLDLSEKGRKNGQVISLDRRLFMQFLAFGDCTDTGPLIAALGQAGIESALYADMNDARGIGLLVLSENAELYVGPLRTLLNSNVFAALSPKPEYTMFGRTYTIGYESDLEETLFTRPRAKIANPDLNWAVWYPLRRVKSFETIPEEEQRKVLGEHGGIGMAFGRAGYATDIRLACHGLDKNDNDFVVALLGKELYPLSACVQAMRKTKQTSSYLESLGPFFIGKKIWNS